MKKLVIFTSAMLLLVSVAASAAPLESSHEPGASIESLAADLQTAGDFEKAGAMFQRAADAYRIEGNATANIKAIQESAEAYEKKADTFARGTANGALAPARPAFPSYVPGQAVAP